MKHVHCQWHRIVVASLLALLGANGGFAQTVVKGWTLLSNDSCKAELAVKTAKQYDINHLQLSHLIVHDLREVRQPAKQKQVNSLIKLAHREGTKDVYVWDHSFYNLDYYPKRFRTAPHGKIDLDNPEFWEWYKNDYRQMLSLIPDVDGIILTFIETGAYAEHQYSKNMLTAEEKLAAVVNAIAEVVVREYGKQMFIRTFAYSQDEYESTVGCIKYIKEPQVGIMMKEVPHDFFLTHPNNAFIGEIKRPTLVEFDTGNEYNGQGVIANTWPEYIQRRWCDYLKRPNVIGYVARTDRYGDTQIIGTSNEIQLYALKRITEQPDVTTDALYDEFLSKKYGMQALPHLKTAFKCAYSIVTSTLYTLGTNLADHSSLNLASNQWSYNRHVSGRWLSPPVVFVEHDVNREFHYWKDIINHIAPPKYKQPASPWEKEIKEVFAKGWLLPTEQMDSTYYNYILAEKKYGLRLSQKALGEIKKARPCLAPDDYAQLYGLFYRTYLTARLYTAVCTAYYGYRVYARGDNYRPTGLEHVIAEALQNIEQVSQLMYAMKGNIPIGQYNWLHDADTALEYKAYISARIK